MVYYPSDERNGVRSSMYSQRSGPVNPMRRQDEAYYYPNQMMRQNERYHYPNQMRNRDEAYYYQDHIRRDEAYYYPNQTMSRREAYMDPREIRRRDEAYYYPYPMRGQNPPPNPNHRPRSNFERLPEQLNSIAGHMGTITQGINIMRQVGSLLSMFRK